MRGFLLLGGVLRALFGRTLLPGLANAADVDCSDFGSQASAQSFFLNHGGSPSNNVDGLDANHNGVACESNPHLTKSGTLRGEAHGED